MRRLLLVATVVAVFVLLVSAVAASANGNTTTLRLISRDEAGSFIDNPPAATGEGDVSQGDMFVFTSRLFRGGRRVGRGHVACTITLARGERSLSQCVGTFTLRRGQITAQGVVGQADRFTGAITGGTGRYDAARGTLEVRDRGARPDILTFRIIR